MISKKVIGWAFSNILICVMSTNSFANTCDEDLAYVMSSIYTHAIVPNTCRISQEHGGIGKIVDAFQKDEFTCSATCTYAKDGITFPCTWEIGFPFAIFCD